MKILFLCSSLEPGRDGVGDYTRRLAAELIRQGHQCRLISLNERNKKNAETLNAETLKGESSAIRNRESGIGNGKTSDLRPPPSESSSSLSTINSRLSTLCETQLSEGTSVECLRLPGTFSLAERMLLARRWVKDFNPDWLSLQYVCYGFHPKGLAWRWNPIFVGLGMPSCRRHLMFHELWIGEGGHTSSWRRIIGTGQRYIIQNLNRRLQPDLCTTSTPLFQRRLSRAGINARVLPLFGNIPVFPQNNARVMELLMATSSRIAEKPRATFLTGVLFGGIHPNFDTKPLNQWLARLGDDSGKPVLLILIGRTGAAAESFTRQVTGMLTEGLEVVVLGEQPAEIISQTLQFADFGINTGSPEFLGKSGTFAAMQEHGLPVVLADGSLDIAQLEMDPPVWQFSTSDSAAKRLDHQRSVKADAGVTQTAVALLALMEKAGI